MYRCILAISFLFIAFTARAQDEETYYYFSVDWSPDGEKLAFSAGLDGQLSIYTVDIDGGNLTRLTNGDYNDEGPVWSPDGSRIAFVSNRRALRGQLPISLQIYVMNADGSDQRRVTHEGPALEYNVSWSPDGDRLVFQSRPEINPGVHSLYVIGLDGLGRERLTDGMHDDTRPQWSPDGRHILFIQAAAVYKFFADITPEERAMRRDSWEIAVLDLNDGGVTPITHDQIRESDPSWNADGSEIYYFEHRGEQKNFLRRALGDDQAVMVADGNQVSNSSIVSRTRLSPNGRYLAYHKEVGGIYGIYFYDLERGEERLLIGGSSAD